MILISICLLGNIVSPSTLGTWLRDWNEAETRVASHHSFHIVEKNLHYVKIPGGFLVFENFSSVFDTAMVRFAICCLRAFARRLK